MTAWILLGNRVRETTKYLICKYQTTVLDPGMLRVCENDV